MPGKDELPEPLKRSSAKARRTWIEAHDNAVRTYGEGERAHRTAFAALKHTHQKVGDHWVAKKRPGPSDAQAARGGRAARAGSRRTAGGVDVLGSTRDELLDRARELGIRGRWEMTKQQLGEAIARRQA
jgi:hypothetical protein